jgi:Family of unknown function (DUF5761)
MCLYILLKYKSNNQKKMQNIRQNGRVHILTPKTSDLFQLYDNIPVRHPVSYRNPTEGIWISTPLSVQYFSAENIYYLQKKIQEGVYFKSNRQFQIALQDEDQLKIVMRSIYLQYAKNKKGDIDQQINQLNQMVLAYCIPQVYSEALSYKKYLYDASTMYKPMNRPVMSSMDDKTLELKRFF